MNGQNGFWAITVYVVDNKLNRQVTYYCRVVLSIIYGKNYIQEDLHHMLISITHH